MMKTQLIQKAPDVCPRCKQEFVSLEQVVGESTMSVLKVCSSGHTITEVYRFDHVEVYDEEASGEIPFVSLIPISKLPPLGYVRGFMPISTLINEYISPLLPEGCQWDTALPKDALDKLREIDRQRIFAPAVWLYPAQPFAPALVQPLTRDAAITWAAAYVLFFSREYPIARRDFLRIKNKALYYRERLIMPIGDDADLYDQLILRAVLERIG